MRADKEMKRWKFGLSRDKCLNLKREWRDAAAEQRKEHGRS